MTIKLLKQLDQFAQAPTFRVQRGSTKRQKYYWKNYGSWFGFVLTLVISFLSVGYLSFLLFEMDDYYNDVYRSQSITNNFEEGYNDFNITDYNFMPSMEVRLLNQPKALKILSQNNIDIFADDDLTIDATKIRKYIKVV